MHGKIIPIFGQIMLSQISASSFTNILPSLQNYLTQNSLIQRIHEIVSAIFAKLSLSLDPFNHPAIESNVKPVAAFGCLVIIAIIIISFFRKRDENFVLPLTPYSQRNEPSS